MSHLFDVNDCNDLLVPFEWSGPAVTGGSVYDNHPFVFTAIDGTTTLFSHSDDTTSHDTSVVGLSAEGTIGFLTALATNTEWPSMWS